MKFILIPNSFKHVDYITLVPDFYVKHDVFSYEMKGSNVICQGWHNKHMTLLVNGNGDFYIKYVKKPCIIYILNNTKEITTMFEYHSNYEKLNC